MSRYYSYINSAKEIINRYNGEEPLSSFLKKHFSSNKKFGSKDRKSISHLCYCYYRLGKAATANLPIEERILTGLYLCSNESNEILAALKPEWDKKVYLPVSEKLLIINYSLLVTEVFPSKEELSNGIDHKKFCESFFIQPDVFLRVKPGKKESVIKKLKESDLQFQVIDNTLALTNATKLEDIVEIDTEVVVQDYNSQRTGEFIKSAIGDQTPGIRVWDCCAASGGKSIMAYDIDPNIDLTVSDIRESILINLRKRFARAGIKDYHSFIADLANDKFQTPNTKFQVIICDTPCSGSGTWSRTPEQLYFFKEHEIERYSALQKRIVSNVIPHLNNKGSFIYITCSVFKKENEEVVEFIKQNFHLQVKQMEILKGYDKKADSMFVAVFSNL